VKQFGKHPRFRVLKKSYILFTKKAVRKAEDISIESVVEVSLKLLI
jgi:hypothetical protein